MLSNGKFFWDTWSTVKWEIQGVKVKKWTTVSVETRSRNSDKTEMELFQDTYTLISKDLRMSGKKEIEYYLLF